MWFFSPKFHPHQPDLLASGCIGGSVRLWDLNLLYLHPRAPDLSPRLPPTISSRHAWKHGRAIASVTFHPTNPILVVAWSQDIEFLDWSTGSRLASWSFASEHTRTGWVHPSTDGAHIYAAIANPLVDSMGPFIPERSRKILDSFGMQYHSML